MIRDFANRVAKAAVRSSAVALAVALAAGPKAATAQQCPPNSHARSVSFAGNLQGAHCWCNDGYQNVGGVCVLTTPARPAAPDRGPQAAPIAVPAR
jgi:hypothetical protein